MLRPPQAILVLTVNKEFHVEIWNTDFHVWSHTGKYSKG